MLNQTLPQLTPDLSLSNSPGTQLLKGPEKAAIIIGLLGSEHARPIVDKIEDHHVRRFINALSNLQNIPRETMLAAVADFITELGQRKGGFRGGPEAVNDLMASLFDADRVAYFVGKPDIAANDDRKAQDIWAAMKQKKSTELIAFLSKQRPDVISPILSQFSPIESGEILADLPEDISVQCIRIMASGQMPNAQTMDAIARLVQMEFLTADAAESSDKAALFVSDILGVLPRERRETMLDMITKSDPDKAKIIRDAMLTFEDLPTRLPTSAIPIIFKDLAQDKLLPALKAGAAQSQATVDYLFGNISQRMAGQVQEQIADMADLSAKESDKAISDMMIFIGLLEKQKRITLIKPKAESA